MAARHQLTGFHCRSQEQTAWLVEVVPGLDHDGDPVLFVEIQFRHVEPGIDLNALSQSTLAVRRALWAIGERRYPHLRYDFHDDQRMLGTEHW